MAARFCTGQIFTFRPTHDPDSTPWGWGDQYDAVFEMLMGYTVAKNPATSDLQVADCSWMAMCRVWRRPRRGPTR